MLFNQSKAIDVTGHYCFHLNNYFIEQQNASRKNIRLAKVNSQKKKFYG